MSSNSPRGPRPGISSLTTRESRDLARWLQAQVQVVATQAAEAIWDQVPAYRNTDLFSDVAAHCRRIFAVFIDTIIDERVPTVEDFPFTARHAAKRVTSGVGLSDFLKAYRIAQMVLWQHVISHVAGNPPAETNALELVSHVMRTIEVGSSAAATTYIEAQQYAIADQEQIRRDCLEHLLRRSTPDDPAHRGAMTSAGLAQPGHFVVLSAVIGTSIEGPAAEIESAKRAELRRRVGGLIVNWRSRLVGIVPTSPRSAEDLLTRLRSFAADSGSARPMHIGVSTLHNRLRHAADALQEAELARADVGSSGGVVALSDFSPVDYLMRRPDPTLRRLISAGVQDFLEEDARSDGRYLETLAAFVEHGLNARSAAKSLFIHPNTIYQRLDRISEQTDWDPRDPRRAMDLLIAARALAQADSAVTSIAAMLSESDLSLDSGE